MFRRSATKSTPSQLEAPPSPTEKKETDPYFDYEDPAHYAAEDLDKKSSHSNNHEKTPPLSALSPRERQKRFREELLNIFIKYILRPFYDFFHARTGPKGCRISGWIRFWFSVIFIYSRILFALDLDFLMDPVNGVMPYEATQEDMYSYEWSVFRMAPNSRLVLYAVFYSGLAAGFGLFLGVLPRWSAVILFITMQNIHNHSRVIWDNQEHMFRMWCFFLIFMPLDHITVYDAYGGWCQRVKNMPFLVDKFDALERRVSTATSVCMRKCPLMIQTQCRRLKLDQDLESGATSNGSSTNTRRRHEQSTSWPMWPFRIFQIYICIVYLAAGLCKFNTSPWKDGTALWWLPYDGGYGRFFPAWVTEYLFNRMGVVKFQTWSALVIEIGCIFTIWIPKLRWPTFLAVIALHVGIELALIMHAFEYLSVLGWLTFFVLPNDGEKKKQSADKDIAPEETDSMTILKSASDDGNGKVNKKGGIISKLLAPSRRKVLVESVLVATLLYFFVVDALPRQDLMDALPRGVGRMMKHFMFPTTYTRRISLKYGEMLGIHTGPWILYKGTPAHSDFKLTAVIQYNNGTKPSVWQDEDLYERNDLYSLYMRERNYWGDCFKYHLSDFYDSSNEGIPYFGSFAMHLARQYSDGYIKFHSALKGGPRVRIDSNSPIKSVSIMAHSAVGRGPPKGIGLWESVPRSWYYEDNCNYVLQMTEFGNDFEKSKVYDYDENVDFEEESGCSEMDKIDRKLHMRYGSLRPKYSRRSRLPPSGDSESESDD